MVQLFRVLIGRRKLPESMIQHTISKMVVGEVAYTLPWAMWADTDRNGWLHPDYPAKKERSGNSDMRVIRMKDGFHVWVPRGQTYTLTTQPGYCSSEDTQYLPVVSIA